MRVWCRIGPMLAVVLALNLLPMVSATTPAVAQERPTLTYFALGDSYASGHGLQDDPGDGKAGAYGAGDERNCRRSPSSYPYLVAGALKDTYTVDMHHFACSGATAAPTTLSTGDDRYHPDKSLRHQVETANAILDERDRTGTSGPVLVTITIGANDLGIDGAEAEAIKQVFQPISSNFTGPEFFRWLDGKTATITANLTPIIDSLLDHENVRIVLTDYPNPFREDGFALFCPDFFGSLTCDERMDHLMLSLTATMAGQVGRVDDRSHLHITTLGSRFAPHYSNCAPFTPSDNAPETWFQDEIQVSDYTRVINNAEYNIILNDLIANMDQCFHPNAAGAQGIADAVLERTLTMLPTPTTAQPTQSESGAGSLTVQFWDVRNNVPDNTTQCVQLVGATEVLCAIDFPDGQILMNGIPAGTYEVCVTRFYPDDPGGPVWAWFRSPASVTIAPGSHETITLNLYMDFEPGERTLCGFDDTAPTSGSSADSAERTWTASVQVSLCDDSSCQAGAGITVDISLASGEWMGSCTTSEPMPTPWDVYISTCTVEGLPYHEDFVATQDPSTIPEGYVPANDPQTLHVEDIHPGGGDQAVFMFTNVRTDGGDSMSDSSGTSAPAEPAAPTEVAVATEPTGAADPMALLPSIADVPGGLVETGRYTRSLSDVAANYTDPAETTQLFTAWGWQGNAVAAFSLPSDQPAHSGQVNGVYVSIHAFDSPDAAREALDFSLSEQAAGTVLQEITTSPVGEYTRALYGPMDYGNETTVLTQQGSYFIRVSAAIFDGDPTADAVAVTEAILLKAGSAPATGSASSSTASTTIVADTSGSTTAPAPGGAGEATLLMTFRGCPEGFDPDTGDFWTECTEPLDAPDNAFLNWGGDGQGGRYITELDRQYDGAYVHNAKSATMSLQITGLAPVVRDDYQVIGADDADGDGYTIYLSDGETREVYVFYWFN